MKKLLSRANGVLSAMPKPLVFAMGFMLVAIFGGVDLLLKNEILFSAFYLLPITMIAWFAGWGFAVAASVLSVALLFADDISSRMIPLHSIALYWDVTGRLGFFLIISYSLSMLKNAFDHQRELARTDSLTDLRNSRAFYEMADIEIERAKRYQYPLSI
jgi:glucose-6-phosphate-specific signal transduction histidine kinase